MAFSDTVAQTTFTTRRVVEHAARRCKMTAQQLSAEHLDIAKDALYLLLSDLANGGVPLWCIQKFVYPLYEGTPYVTTYAGTVDILNANLRTLGEQTGTETVTATNYLVEFDTAAALTTVGILWSATAAPIEIARSDDGVTWTVIQTEAPEAGANERTWYDLDTSVASLFFRIRATTGTLDYTSIFLGNTPTEIPLARMNRDDYTSLPNKSFQSRRPLQYWLDRQALSPVLNLWPVPSAAAETSQLVLWAHRHIMDVGTLTQELELPQRWYEAVVSLLAAKLAQEFVEVDPQLIGLLDGKAQQALYAARMEERDNSPINWAPMISAYTR